jgi:hypothetical protein
MKLHPYKENTEIIWRRKVMIAGWCALSGVIIAVFLVTGCYYLFG